MQRESILTLFISFLLPLLLHGEIPLPMVYGDISDEIIGQQLDSVSLLIDSDDYNAASTYLNQLLVPKSDLLASRYYHLLGKILTHQGAYREAIVPLRKSLSLVLGKEDTIYADISNSLGNCYLRLSEFDQAIKEYNKVLEIRKKVLGPNHIKVGYVYNNLGLIEETKANLEEALYFYSQSLAIAKHNYGDAHPETADAYLAVGGINRIKGNYTVANDFFQKALSIHLDASGPDHPTTAAVYLALGFLHGQTGNNVKSLAYFSKATAIYKTTLGEAHPMFCAYKYLTGLGHINLNQHDKAEVILNEVVAFQKDIGDVKGVLTALAYEHLGKVHLAKNNKAVATDYYDRSLGIYESIHGINHPDTYTAYISKGKALCEREDNLQEGLIALKKALQIGQELYTDDPTKLFEIYLEIGKCYLVLGEYKKADSFLYLAYNLLPVEDQTNLYSSYDLGNVEIELAHLSLKKYQENRDVAELYQASERLPRIERRLDYLKRYFQSIDSGQSLIDQFFDFYQYAIEINYHLYEETGDQQYANKAFAYSEKSKTFILMRTLHDEEALQVAGIPDSIIAKANALSADITYKEKLLFENNQLAERDESLHTSLTSQLFDLQETHEQLLTSIEQGYPTYYQLKYDLKPASINNLQQDLSAEQTLVEYFVSDQSIYVFLLNKDKIILKELPKPTDLPSMVQAFRKSIHDYDPLKNNERSIKQYADLGHTLYQQLIAPIQADLRPQITFITNGLLEYLPFDALVIEAPKDPTQFQNYTYLVSNYAISYAYSATWLNTILKKSRQSFSANYLGVAPSFTLKKGSKKSSRSNVFDPLKYNQSEVENIKEIMNGEVLIGAAATAEAFKEQAKLYQILHLATHGESNKAQGNYSFLAFATSTDTTQGQVLYVKDLQNINLPTELVVLSACETGIGELQRGEGVVSVGKGFSYAGARSVLTTLWKINDNSAAKLMPLFFENIKAGQAKDIALANAKNTFIKTQRHIHPYYWSGYLVYGDTSELKSCSLPTVFLGGLFGTLGFGLLTSFLFLKFRKKL